MALSGADTDVGACLGRNIGCEENQARKQQDFAVKQNTQGILFIYSSLQEECWDQALCDTIHKVRKTPSILIL